MVFLTTLAGYFAAVTTPNLPGAEKVPRPLPEQVNHLASLGYPRNDAGYIWLTNVVTKFDWDAAQTAIYQSGIRSAPVGFTRLMPA